jgi:hypothetical protein
MVDLTRMKQAARYTTDENGQPVVQIPLAVWEETAGENQFLPSQKAQIEALFAAWAQEPHDDKSPEWWADFDRFMAENRVNFPERDLGLDSE